MADGVNLYAYADGNPVAFSDPFGLMKCKDPNDLLCKMAEQITGRTRGLQGAVAVGFAIQVAPLVVAAGPELLTGAALNTTNLAGPSAAVAAASRTQAPQSFLRDANRAASGLAQRFADWMDRGAALPAEVTTRYLQSYRVAAQAAIEKYQAMGGREAAIKLQQARIAKIDQLLNSPK